MPDAMHQNIYALPPGIDFANEFASGFFRRFAAMPPEATASITILANSGRMQRALIDALAAQKTGLLPRVGLVTQIELLLPVSEWRPAGAHTALRQRLELTQLVTGLLEQQPDLAPKTSAFDLADSLARLFAEMQSEGVPAAALAGIDTGEMSGHWGRSLAFLNIAQRFLKGGSLDKDALQRLYLEALRQSWLRAPPQQPVIVAGSTGSRGTTSDLMDLVTSQAQGFVVLPGFDMALPDEAWAAMDGRSGAEDHPQYRFFDFMKRHRISARDIPVWNGEARPSPRNQLVSLALRPAPVTDQWLSEGPKLDDIGGAVEGLSLIEASSPREEALALASAMRFAVEKAQSAVLISPDRTLTRQVTAALDRWGIEPDDSAGRPLALSPPGRFMRHVLHLLTGRASSTDLLVVLKHPITASGSPGRGAHLRWTRELELFLRRKGLPFPTGPDIQRWADRIDGAGTWAAWVSDCLNTTQNPFDNDLSNMIDHHRKLAERLAAGPASTEGPKEIWAKEAGRLVERLMNDLADAAAGIRDLTIRDYAALFEHQIAHLDVRQPDPSHPDIKILGTLEARIKGADIVLLGGLNEGIWPSTPAPDPWLNRTMRKQAGLLLPERQIGLSAHDFQQAIGHPTVILSRAIRDDAATTVPSRWINRLSNLLTGLKRSPDGRDLLAEMQARGQIWVRYGQALDRQASPSVQRARRPSPVPTHAPRHMSVTQIRTLIRDPYAIYASKILRLRKLGPLMPQPDAALRGTVFHKGLETFMRRVQDGRTSLSADALTETAAEILNADLPWPAARRLWLARLGRVADWFVANETSLAPKARQMLFEQEGTLQLPALDFTLSAKADRIDLLPDGRVRIIDYKTGTPPSKQQQLKFDHQLLLEAMMVEDAAFKGLGSVEAAQAIYVGLGTKPEIRPAPLDVLPPSVMRQHLQDLLRAYVEDGKGFTALRAAESERFEGDFDHLSRRGEWELTDHPEKVILA